MHNRRTRRTRQPIRQPLSFDAFTRELIKAVDGDPKADPHVKDFLDEFSAQFGLKAAVSHPNGIEILRKRGGAR